MSKLRRSAALCFIVLFVASFGTAHAQQQQRQQPQQRFIMPPDETLIMMITNTLIAYNNAAMTGNYSVLRDLGTLEFREANSVSQLADLFRNFRVQRNNIASIVLQLPKLIKKPQIDKDGDLILEGFFDTRPKRVKFFLVFRVDKGLWKLFAISVEPQDAQAITLRPRPPQQPQRAATQPAQNQPQQRQKVANTKPADPPKSLAKKVDEVKLPPVTRRTREAAGVDDPDLPKKSSARATELNLKPRRPRAVPVPQRRPTSPLAGG